jgi:uncharacterized phage protein (TIGR01671 family)
MREIKFEYGFGSVNGIVKKVYHLSQIPNIKNICDLWDSLPIVYVRKWTGLKDKNGVEIYDGDILYYSLFDHNDNDIQYKGIVRWFGTGFVVTREPDDKGEGKYGLELFWIYNQDSELKVIGNIHFNPELIK